MRKNKGFSLIEVSVGLAITAIVTSVGYGVLATHQKQKQNISRLQDMYSVKNEMQQAIGSNDRCLQLMAGNRIRPAQFSSITDSTPRTLNQANATQALGRNFSGQARLYGVDNQGVRVLVNENGKSTVRALLGLEMTSHSVSGSRLASNGATFFTHRIPLTLLIDNASGNIEACQSSPYGSSPVQDLCASLGEDFKYDLITKQCLVPVYNCCRNEACERRLLRGSHKPKKPCKWVKLQDALCDLEKRGRVPGNPHCT